MTSEQFDYSKPYDPIYGWARKPFAKFLDSKVIECPKCKTGALIVPETPCGTCIALDRKLMTL